MRHLISEIDIINALRNGEHRLSITPQTLVTPLARDTARDKGLLLVTENPSDTWNEGEVPSSPKTIVIGSDHRGLSLKNVLRDALRGKGLEVIDAGTLTDSPCDYPVIASVLCRIIQQGVAELGVMIDGAGIGSAIACSKHPGIRAAHCHEILLARYAREHNHANVITMGASFIAEPLAREILETFLHTQPLGGRHAERVALLKRIEALTFKS